MSQVKKRKIGDVGVCQSCEREIVFKDPYWDHANGITYRHITKPKTNVTEIKKCICGAPNPTKIKKTYPINQTGFYLKCELCKRQGLTYQNMEKMARDWNMKIPKKYRVLTMGLKFGYWINKTMEVTIPPFPIDLRDSGLELSWNVHLKSSDGDSIMISCYDALLAIDRFGVID